MILLLKTARIYNKNKILNYHSIIRVKYVKTCVAIFSFITDYAILTVLFQILSFILSVQNADFGIFAVEMCDITTQNCQNL